MSQNKWPLSSFLLPSTLPLPLSSTYEFSFTWTKIRPLSKGQSDELKEKDTLPDLCPLGYKYSEQALGEILCLHRQTPGSRFLLLPVPTRSATQGQESEKSKHLHATSSMICPQKAFALPLVTRGMQAFLEINGRFHSSTISKADTRVHALQSKP